MPPLSQHHAWSWVQKSWLDLYRHDLGKLSHPVYLASWQRGREPPCLPHSTGPRSLLLSPSFPGEGRCPCALLGASPLPMLPPHLASHRGRSLNYCLVTKESQIHVSSPALLCSSPGGQTTCWASPQGHPKIILGLSHPGWSLRTASLVLGLLWSLWSLRKPPCPGLGLDLGAFPVLLAGPSLHPVGCTL